VTKISIKTNLLPSHNAWLAAIDNIFLILLVILVAGRCQINETLAGSRITDTSGPYIGSAQTTAMLIFAGLVFTIALSWLSLKIITATFSWRGTCLIIPTLLLLAGSVLGSLSASDKHIAFVTSATILSQLLLAIILIQLLNKQWKRRLVLAAIAATGLVTAYHCWEQIQYDIPQTVAKFEKDPAAFMRAQGIEPDSYAAYQFTGRLKSRDVSGYFTTSNVTASFFILSIAAALALISSRRQNHDGQLLSETHNIPISTLLTVLVLALQIAALLITKSKGAIASWAVSILLLTIIWRYRTFLIRHRLPALCTGAAIITIGIGLIVTHGLYHGRLPGNSMWLRWQYWQAGAAMIADHWLTGVGPGNFGLYYTKYMIAAAPEVITDPHCLPVALWSQWGAFGIAGFILAGLLTCRRLSAPDNNNTPATPTDNTVGSRLIWLCSLTLTIGIVVIRRAAGNLSGLESDELYSIYLLYFLVPAAIWLAGFFLMTRLIAKSSQQNYDSPPCHMDTLIISCGLFGFLLHNSIDLAIFQPGVGTCFMAMLAVALANKQPDNQNIPSTTCTYSTGRTIVTLLLLTATVAMWAKVLIPACTAQNCIDHASEQLPQNPAAALTALDKADSLYPYDPRSAYYRSRIYDAMWQEAPAGPEKDILLEKTTASLLNAISRDPANFRYYSRLGSIYQTAAQQNNSPELLALACDYAHQALEHYPAKSELLINYGLLLIETGKADQAKAFLERALKIEQDFIDQQKQMYPDRLELIPRLSPQLRDTAIAAMEQ